MSLKLHIDSGRSIASVDPRLFGSFVEHMGRCIHTVIFEPSHPGADAAGFRQDVATLIKELAPAVLRHPGGNFVSTYNREDGVGRSVPSRFNRHLEKALPLEISADQPCFEHLTLTHADPQATNTAETPDRVAPCPASQSGTLPPLSWNVLRFQMDA